MAFGDFLRGIVAQVNPWDNGKTYGSYNPPKKRPDDQPMQNNAGGLSVAPAQNGQNSLTVQQPQNHFQTGLTHLSLPGTPPPTTVSVAPSSALPLAQHPQPGAVVQPTTQLAVHPVTQPMLQPPQAPAAAQPKPGYTAPTTPGSRGMQNGYSGTYTTTGFVPDHAAPAPDHSILGQIKSGLHTAGETAVGSVENVPEAGLAAARAVSGAAQAFGELPHMVTAGAATGTQALQQHMNNPVTRQVNRAFQDANTGIKTATHYAINDVMDPLNRGIDSAAHSYADLVPGAAGGEQVYKREQIPINALIALSTLGGSAALEGAGTAGEAGQAGRLGSVVNKVSSFLNKPLNTNADNVIARTAQAIGNRTAPITHAANNPISAVKNAVTRFMGNTGAANDTRMAVDAAEAGNVMNGVEDLTRPPTQIQVQQPTPIDVTAPTSEPTPIPVTNNTPTGKPIVEVGGDTPGKVKIPTANEVAADRARTAFDNQAPGRPDRSVDGVDPTKSITKADKAEYQTVLDDRLSTGRLSEADHATLTDQLNKIPASDAPVPAGTKINVKSVDSIPVQNETTVPNGLPETPGTVRPTAQSAPAAVESQAAATAPVAAAPAALPSIPKVGSTMEDGTKVTKRMVASMRQDAKNAKAYAKAQAAKEAATSTVTHPEPTSNEGFAKTDSYNQGKNGNLREDMSIAAEKTQAQHETANMSPEAVLEDARANKAKNNAYTARDFRNIQALFDTKRVTRDMPIYNQLKAALKDIGSQAGQFLREQGQVIRRTASADEIVSRYESKLYGMVKDPTKIDSTMFDQVEAATNKFTDARDAANTAYNTFTEAPTKANAKAYHAAQDAADAADKEAKLTEYTVAKKALKGNTDVKASREVNKMAHESDMGQMDSIDASMLSGTGTFIRNFVNSAIGGAEEAGFGGIGSRVAKLFTGENVGGGIGRSSFSGLGKGTHNIVDASKARAGEAGWNLLAHARNWSTTGNQLGDSIIDAQVQHSLLDHYTQTLKEQGYTGQELKDRAAAIARRDPGDGVSKPGELTHTYAGYAKAAAGLGSGVAKGSSVETAVKNMLSDAISFGNPGRASEAAAKLITRMTVGFPSAVGRTIVEGVKRTPVIGQLYDTGKIITANDPAQRALAIKEAVKHLGTAATVTGLFYHLGKSGAVTGSYPTDPAERAQWTRDGVTENSIKVDGTYYQLPSYLGSAALPALFAATLGRNNGDFAKSAVEIAKGIPSILPTSTADNLMNVINGKTNAVKYATATAASATRALTPVGALLNQVAKSFDSTENDTNSGNVLTNFVDKVASGIPGENKFMNIPDKTDDVGNVLHNPNGLQLAAGASSTTQGAGTQETAKIAAQVDSNVKAMADTGALGDATLKSILDDPTKKLYDDINSGKKVSPANFKKVQDALLKGVSNNGEDTAYLEKGQYDTHLAALKLKRSQLAADPTMKPSELAALDLNIKRGQVYKDNKIPYTDITDYKNTSVSDWRKMGDDTSDSYDPAMYQKLWNIDQLMTKAGASYDPKDPTGAKFTAKAPGKGKGGAGSVAGGWNAAFGQLKNGVGAPTVQNYQTISSQSGSNMPNIQITHPNIVHKIGSSG